MPKKLDKKSKGITLIALIVTIIVLIILAGIAISMLTGDNNILSNATEAREETQKATATELMTIKLTGIEMKSFNEKKRKPTLKEVADELSKDEDEIQYIHREATPTASLTHDINDSDTCFYTKLRKYPYEFKINNNLKIESINGVPFENDTPTENQTLSAEDILFTPEDVEWENINNVQEALNYLLNN